LEKSPLVLLSGHLALGGAGRDSGGRVADDAYGITAPPPEKNAFLTAIYCVLVPFFSGRVKRSVRGQELCRRASVPCRHRSDLADAGNDHRLGGRADADQGGAVRDAHRRVATLGRRIDPARSIVFQFAAAALLFGIAT
jgi:hypothetical protein